MTSTPKPKCSIRSSTKFGQPRIVIDTRFKWKSINTNEGKWPRDVDDSSISRHNSFPICRRSCIWTSQQICMRISFSAFVWAPSKENFFTFSISNKVYLWVVLALAVAFPILSQNFPLPWHGNKVLLREKSNAVKPNGVVWCGRIYNVIVLWLVARLLSTRDYSEEVVVSGAVLVWNTWKENETATQFVST